MSKTRPSITTVFPTHIYRADVAAPATLIAEIEVAALSLAHDDVAGNKWCEKHGYPGYTSYASLNDLSWRIPAFKRLENILDRHALAFAKALHWDIGKGRPVCDSLWVNVLPEGGSHTGPHPPQQCHQRHHLYQDAGRRWPHRL